MTNTPALSRWQPGSWRNYPASQQPHYSDSAQLAQCLESLQNKPPIVTRGEVDKLSAELEEAALGHRFILHGGDCAECFSDCRADVLRDTLYVLLQMSMVLTYAMRKPVIRIGRIAGQYAKPRSQDMEEIAGQTLPVYRGDLINSHEATAEARKADPSRMITGYHNATASLNYIRALIEGGYADLHHPDRWNLSFIKDNKNRQAYDKIVDAISDAIRFMTTIGALDSDEPLRRISFFTSHEALLLPYEEALTRKDSSEGYYNLGAHFLWIGYRTSDLKGAHVEYLRGIGNPIGIKVGPNSKGATLVRLIKTLNPQRIPGRITLITRFGTKNIGSMLPPLVKALQRAKQPVLWSCDPMHGNTEILPDGRKTRQVKNIFSELEQCFHIHASLNSNLGGVHFEQTGAAVTECIGGSLHDEAQLNCYETRCDPRLNGAQALEMAFLIAGLLR